MQIFIDGAARGNPGPAGIGVLIKNGSQTILEVSDFIGETTNNVAEYEALLRGLVEANKLNINQIEVISDSELLVKQIKGEYRVKNESLKPLFEQAQELIQLFSSFKITHVRREKNKAADKLANQGIDAQTY